MHDRRSCHALEPFPDWRCSDGMTTRTIIRVLMFGLLLSLPASAAPASAELRPSVVSSRPMETIAGGATGSWRVQRTGTTTQIRWTSGATTWSTNVPKQFGLPVVTSRGLRAGPTLDGSAIALAAEPKRIANSWSSTFVVVAKTSMNTVSMPGQWAYDAISPDGATLFLIESVGGGRYWVRSVDAGTGRLGERLVTKTVSFDPATTTVEDGPMEGLALDRLASTDGRTVFTLYDGPSHPFVHALNIAEGWALCYDLPGDLRARAAVLHLRRGPADGTVNVVSEGAIVAQITTSGTRWGPSVRVAGTDRPPVNS